MYRLATSFVLASFFSIITAASADFEGAQSAAQVRPLSPANLPEFLRLSADPEISKKFKETCGKSPAGKEECGSAYHCPEPIEGRILVAVIWPSTFELVQYVQSNPLGLISTGTVTFLDQGKLGFFGGITGPNLRPDDPQMRRQFDAEQQALQKRYDDDLDALIACLTQ